VRTIFERLAKQFEALQGELERTGDAVLRGLIILRMRHVLDEMHSEERKDGHETQKKLQKIERSFEKMAA